MFMPHLPNLVHEVAINASQYSSISGYRLLEAREKQFLCVSIIALATDTNINILDRLYKNQATTGTYIQWPAYS